MSRLADNVRMCTCIVTYMHVIYHSTLTRALTHFVVCVQRTTGYTEWSLMQCWRQSSLLQSRYVSHNCIVYFALHDIVVHFWSIKMMQNLSDEILQQCLCEVCCVELCTVVWFQVCSRVTVVLFLYHQVMFLYHQVMFLYHQVMQGLKLFGFQQSYCGMVLGD